jgi:hypothetical protein
MKGMARHRCTTRRQSHFSILRSLIQATLLPGPNSKKEEEEEEHSTHLDSNDLRVQLPSLVGSHTSSNDSPRDTASTPQSSLGGQEDVWDVLVFAEEGKVKNDLDWLDVGGKDDELADTSVEGLGSFVGSAMSADFISRFQSRQG